MNNDMKPNTQGVKLCKDCGLHPEQAAGRCKECNIKMFKLQAKMKRGEK